MAELTEQELNQVPPDQFQGYKFKKGSNTPLPKYGPNKRPLCMDCNQEIPEYPNVPAGYQSPEIWFNAEMPVNGVMGHRPVHKLVCKDCYNLAFKRRYINETPPL